MGVEPNQNKTGVTSVNAWIVLGFKIGLGHVQGKCLIPCDVSLALGKMFLATLWIWLVGERAAHCEDRAWQECERWRRRRLLTFEAGIGELEVMLR